MTVQLSVKIRIHPPLQKRVLCEINASHDVTRLELEDVSEKHEINARQRGNNDDEGKEHNKFEKKRLPPFD